MSLPSLSRLFASGPTRSPATIGAITTVAPTTTCSICYDPFYGCDRSSEQAAQRRRTNGDTPPPEWPNCPPDQWYTLQPVAVLNCCGHVFHKGCIDKHVRQCLLNQESAPFCPLCRVEISQDECIELMEVVDELNNAHVNWPNPWYIGQTRYYVGPQGRRRKVRIVFQGGVVKHYEGERGAERLVRMNLLNGNVQHPASAKAAAAADETTWSVLVALVGAAGAAGAAD